MTELVLASASPRRAELLRQLGLSFGVLPANIDETLNAGERPAEYALRTANEKAAVISARRDDAIVVAADTVVTIDDHVLGKPVDQFDAERMLCMLSGREHLVLTGVCVSGPSGGSCFVAETKVLFRTLSKEEIGAYWQTGEPVDKAGAYAIQGLGAVFVCRIEGSYSNVVGLPLMEVAGALKDQGIDCLGSAGF